IVPMVAHLPHGIAVRMGDAAQAALRAHGVAAHVEAIALPAGPSPGAAICIQAKYERLSVTFGALGERGRPAEAVGREAANAFVEHHVSGMALEPHLADQILLPLALAAA